MTSTIEIFTGPPAAPRRPATPHLPARPDETACEAALVERLRDGDPRAFEVLVRQYGCRMLSTARRLLANEQDAKDAVQESLLAVHRRISTYSRRAPLSAWLRRIVVNNALLKIRSRRAKQEVSIEAWEPSVDPTEPRGGCQQLWSLPGDVALEQRELRQRVREQVALLPDTLRTALVLRDLEELSTQEAARALGVSETCLKVRLHRARRALKAMLEARGLLDSRSATGSQRPRAAHA